MSAYFNCGANGPGGRPATKKALQALLDSSPEEVYFDGTSFGFDEAKGYRGNEVPPGVILSVVGPDPYNTRRWYATVKRAPDGKIRMS